MNTTNRRGPTLLTHSFLVLVLILLLFAGCSETDDEIPKIATVKIEFTLPTPSSDGPFCKTGDIIQPGGNCFYPGTDIEMIVLDNGTLKVLNFLRQTHFERQIHFKDILLYTTIPFTLIAHRRNDNSWKIDEVGDARNADKLDVIISTDFTREGPGAEVLYHTKHEFALTESFSQDFNLVPDDGTVELAVEIRNNTRFDELSARRIILIDGEVVSDMRLSITRGVWFYDWNHTKIDESVSLF